MPGSIWRRLPVHQGSTVAPAMRRFGTEPVANNPRRLPASARSKNPKLHRLMIFTTRGALPHRQQRPRDDRLV